MKRDEKKATSAPRNKGAFKKMAASLVTGLMALQLMACQKPNADAAAAERFAANGLQIEYMQNGKALYDSADSKTDFDSALSTVICFSETDTSVVGAGAAFADGVLTLSGGGTYVLRGKGNVRLVCLAEQAPVRLVLDGVQLTAAYGAPLTVRGKHKTVCTLTEGSENSLTALANTDIRLAVQSEGDLTLNGTGKLQMTGGLLCGGELKLLGVGMRLAACGDGITADGMLLRGATLQVQAGGRALTAVQGGIAVQGGTLSLRSGADGFSATEGLHVSGGTVLLQGGGFSAATDGTPFAVSGGLTVAAYKGGERPQATGTQNSILVRFSELQAANSLVYIADSAGETVAAFCPDNAYDTLLVSSPQLNRGEKTFLYTGGVALGKTSEGLCDSADGGLLLAQFTIGDRLTKVDV